MAAIFVGTIPLFSMVIGHVWGIERISPSARLGLVLGFGGIVLLVGFPAVPVTGAFVLGCVSSVFGSVSAAFGSNYARRHLRVIGSWEQTIGAFFFGGLDDVACCCSSSRYRPSRGSSTSCTWCCSPRCAAPSPYVLYFRLVAEVGATLAISVEFGVTAIAVVVGAVLLQERLSVVQLVGGAVIIAGCSLVLGIIPGRRVNRSTAPADPPVWPDVS